MAEMHYSITAPDKITGKIYLIEQNLENDTAYYISWYDTEKEAREAVDFLNGK